MRRRAWPLPCFAPLLKDADVALAAKAARMLYQGGDKVMLDWLVLASFHAPPDQKDAYERELELLQFAAEGRPAQGHPGASGHPMIVSLLTLVLSIGPLPGDALTSRWMSLSEHDRAQAVLALESKPLPQRFVDATARFLGTPYVLSPLGEGSGRDPDPKIRYDAVDCVTFVETAMALSLAPRPDTVEPVLQTIRYREKQVYEDRNHLMEAQWIPYNLKKGFIADVTRRYGGADAVAVSKTFSDETWSSPQGKGLFIPKDYRVQGQYSWEVIPLGKFSAKAKAIPSGTILLVVREDKPDVITRISHLGLLVQDNGRTMVRHASSLAKRSHRRAARQLRRAERQVREVAGGGLRPVRGAAAGSARLDALSFLLRFFPLPRRVRPPPRSLQSVCAPSG